jgi:hypothetical protein
MHLCSASVCGGEGGRGEGGRQQNRGGAVPGAFTARVSALGLGEGGWEGMEVGGDGYDVRRRAAYNRVA